MTTMNSLSFWLHDRTGVKLGLVGPGDRNRFLNGFEHISSKTNINRFHTFKTRFTEDELQYLLAIDNINHLAIGAINRDKPDLGIGLARYIRLKKDTYTAEAAIIVIDEYQAKGLGSILYNQLMHCAAENGIHQLLNFVGKDNQGMQGLLNKYGAHKTAEHGYVYEYVIDLPTNLLKAS